MAVAGGSTVSDQTEAAQPHWSSRFAFVMAAIGSAVGLGNLWRFPAEAGANGGGAFVVFYIFCVVLIGLPLLLSETLIGRHGGSSAVESAKTVARDSGVSTGWSALAGVGVLGAFFILSFYSVVAGWVLYYVGVFAGDLVGALGGNLAGGAFAGQDQAAIEALLPALFADPVMLVSLHALFMAVTLFFVARGVSSGIEVVAVWLMPTFFALFLGITVYGAFTGAFAEAVDFLFAFNPERLLHPDVMLSALGQAFFSLSLGSALMITYGAYAGRDTNLAQSSLIIGGADTAVAILAGLCIFPIVFAAGLDAAAGPALMFVSLPVAFQAMPFGSLIGLLFFLMVGFAALTSSVALLEAPSSWLMHRFRVSRGRAAILVAGAAFVAGIFSALGYNLLADVRPLAWWPSFARLDILDSIDTVTGKILLPLSGLLTAIFIGWIADRRLIDAENGLSGGTQLLWRFLVAWLCPIVLTAILVLGIFPGLIG
ncbi:sodium-dependent transporter [Sphingosinithalassobacter sp. LHW66-3]|uniref:sodium-dependent transporter n=1 Tax=Sphingosinithalassobacter sp. LHW66-3 TaxID=3424718 RepID=UPI003D6C4730